MIEKTQKFSIKIYNYEKEIQRTHDEIRLLIESTKDHTIKLRNTYDDYDRHSNFTFKQIETEEKDLLIYAVTAERDISEYDKETVHHDICFSKA